MRKANRYFQWLDGEDAGKVEVLSDITCVDGEYFFNFTSGEACNQRFISQMTRNAADLKGKVMVEVANPSDTWGFETIKMGKYKYMDPAAGEQIVDVPPLEDITGATGNGNNLNVEKSKIGEKRFTPPRYKGEMLPLPSYTDYNGDEEYIPLQSHVQPARVAPAQPIPTFVEQEVVKPTAVVNKKISISGVSETDPVRILANTCKKHPTEVSLTLTINLPSRAIYNIAKSEFEDGGAKFVDCLVEQMNINDIVKSVSDALKTSYELED